MQNIKITFLLSVICLFFIFSTDTEGRELQKKKTGTKNSLRTSSIPPNYSHAYQGLRTDMKVMMSNYGTIGRRAWNVGVDPPDDTMGLEYLEPRYEHLFGAGLWVGGLIDTGVVPNTPPYLKAVTAGYEGNEAKQEMYGGPDTLDKIWAVRDNIKPDNWDAYWGANMPFKKVSDEDFYCKYQDYGPTVNVEGHTPMGIEIIQKSYNWTSEDASGILFLDFTIINKSQRKIRDTYLGYFVDADVGPVSDANYAIQNYSGYYPELRLGYIHNPKYRKDPVGCVFVNSPKLASSLNYTFRWFDFTTNNIPDADDAQRYDNLMAWGQVAQNQSFERPSDTRFIFSFGPFDIAAGESLNAVIAMVSGRDIQNMKEHASRAVEIYRLGYKLPFVPPSPKIKSVDLTQNRKVKLSWDHSPVTAWDDSNRIAYNDSTRNPFGSDTTGGYVFEGYRIYRSIDPSDRPLKESFTLLKQVDLLNDPFEFNVGIETTYVDDNLVRGNTYWYSVTSISIPNEFLQVQGGDTFVLQTKPVESSIRENWVKVVLPFSQAERKNEVLVVPNPYRVDDDYTFENGGWEGKTDGWNENKRLIRFIHVPRKCTIKIYSLAGDLVATLYHEDPIAGQIDWNLLSESNRAIASGIYIFSVESDELVDGEKFGTQVGKFVVIR